MLRDSEGLSLRYRLGFGRRYKVLPDHARGDFEKRKSALRKDLTQATGRGCAPSVLDLGGAAPRTNKRVLKLNVIAALTEVTRCRWLWSKPPTPGDHIITRGDGGSLNAVYLCAANVARWCPVDVTIRRS
jgi:hypothetical protein